LNFSRQRAAEFAPVNFADVLRSAEHLIRHQSRNAEVRTELDAGDELPYVSGDEGQLQQAVIALATNAIDAMPAGGTLRFDAREETNGDGRTKVRVDVSDTGIGIPAENLAKIFDPFFTTKEVGRGTGLGLAVCYGIVTEHGGTLEVESVVGRGTTFTIKLPAIS
jgi:two-component system NtrC family sensor kinase